MRESPWLEPRSWAGENCSNPVTRTPRSARAAAAEEPIPPRPTTITRSTGGTLGGGHGAIPGREIERPRTILLVEIGNLEECPDATRQEPDDHPRRAGADGRIRHERVAARLGRSAISARRHL